VRKAYPLESTPEKLAGAVYLHGQPIEAMKAAIEKLRFGGFTLGTWL
jgi:hypothetical protein